MTGVEPDWGEIWPDWEIENRTGVEVEWGESQCFFYWSTEPLLKHLRGSVGGSAGKKIFGSAGGSAGKKFFGSAGGSAGKFFFENDSLSFFLLIHWSTQNFWISWWISTKKKFWISWWISKKKNFENDSLKFFFTDPLIHSKIFGSAGGSARKNSVGSAVDQHMICPWISWWISKKKHWARGRSALRAKGHIPAGRAGQPGVCRGATQFEGTLIESYR